MRRKQAADILDKLRQYSAEWDESKQNSDMYMTRLSRMLDDAGLEPLVPCHGEAHSNAHIDNCGLCKPRWGWVGPKEPVT